MNKEMEPIGEVVELMLDGSIVLELKNQGYDLIKKPLLSCFIDEEEMVFCGLRLYKDSIDKTRRAVALSMTPEEIESEYPQAAYLVKPYLSAILLGTVHTNRFASGIQPRNIGLHSQFYAMTDEKYRWFFYDNKALSSVLAQITQNPLTKSMLKTLCQKFLQLENTPESRVSLFRILGSCLHDDYFSFKDIIMYLR